MENPAVILPSRFLRHQAAVESLTFRCSLFAGQSQGHPLCRNASLGVSDRGQCPTRPTVQEIINRVAYGLRVMGIGLAEPPVFDQRIKDTRSNPETYQAHPLPLAPAIFTLAPGLW